MRVSAAASAIQQCYESGAISYPRAASGQLGCAGLASTAALCAGLGIDVASPLPLRNRRAHEPVHVLDASLPGFAGVPQHLLPDDLRFLDRVARAQVRAAVLLPIQRPDTSLLPDWARDLPWWRPAPDFPVGARSAADGCDVAVQAELFDFDAEEVAFECLVREGLGRPSSIAEHAARAVERGFVDASGITRAGEQALEGVPPSLTLPGTAHAVERVIDADPDESAAPGPPADLIERCFQVMPELAPRLRAALRKSDGEGSTRMDPVAVKPAGAGEESHEDASWYWGDRCSELEQSEGEAMDGLELIQGCEMLGGRRERCVSTSDASGLPVGAPGSRESEDLEQENGERSPWGASFPQPW